MLLQLPKDVLKYILSIVVYNTYVEKYQHFQDSFEENSQRLTETGHFREKKSLMVDEMVQLSSVHTKVHQILLSVCVWEYGRWTFDERFFAQIKTAFF